MHKTNARIYRKLECTSCHLNAVIIINETEPRLHLKFRKCGRVLILYDRDTSSRITTTKEHQNHFCKKNDKYHTNRNKRIQSIN